MRSILFVLLAAASFAASAQSSNSAADSAAQSTANGVVTSDVAPVQQSALQSTVDVNFEASKIPTKTRTDVRAANAVPLAAAVSFSADNCMSVASGGLSLGVGSVGVAKPIPDFNCQAIRRSQNFGIAMANAANLGARDKAMALLQMQIYEACMAGNGPERSYTAEACQKLALLDEGSMVHTDAAHEQLPVPAATPAPQARRDDTLKKITITGSNGVSTQVPVR